MASLGKIGGNQGRQECSGEELAHWESQLQESQAQEPEVQEPHRSNGIRPELLPRGIRWLCLISGFVLLALLGTARYLTPSPAGLGTHQQLGLPPCTTMVIWNIPCPTCGMTTSWAWVMRGELVQAGRANLGGMMLALIAIGFLPAACYFFISGRATSRHWFSLMLAVSLVTSCCVTLIQWAIRLS